MGLRELIEGSPCILPGHKAEFLAHLETFPDRIEEWLYGVPDDMGSLYQGDIVVNMPVCLIDEDGDVIRASDCVAMISNSCDLQPGRRGNVVASLVLNLSEYENHLRANGEPGVHERLTNIRANLVYSYFYLPASNGFPESFIDFSTMVTINSDYMNSTYSSKRILSLSPYGFYLLLIKLTFHLARMEYWTS